MSVRIPRRRIVGLVCAVAVVMGCEPLMRDALVVATSWPAADRTRIESEFAAWLEKRPEPSARAPVRIDWLILAAGDDLETLAARRRPPDVLLGGPARSFERLSDAKRLAPLSAEGSACWAVARSRVIRPALPSGDPDRTAAPADGLRVAFEDPRNDPISLAWAEDQLGRDGFRDGYARLVQAAAARRRIGRRAGSASAAVERGETAPAIGSSPADPAAPDAVSISWPAGVGIVADGRNRDHAESFVKFLAETGRAGPAPTRSESPTRGSRDLLADLLGATLVDAQDELWDAWEALERSGSPPSQLRWMTEPPPWPPASIAKILSGQGEQAMAMAETLGGQVAPEPSARAWLISSWLSPPRLIDRRVLDELAGADGGRLAREPRFRGWLRAEWTAWARQRYRRVQRRVIGGGPGRTSNSTESPQDHGRA